MFFNTFLGIKLRKFVTQIIIIFGFILITIYVIKIKNPISKNNKTSSEVIFEQESFNETLLKKRKKQSAPILKVKIKYGDTLEKILRNNNFNNDEIFDAIKETKKVNAIYQKSIEIVPNNDFSKDINERLKVLEQACLD